MSRYWQYWVLVMLGLPAVFFGQSSGTAEENLNKVASTVTSVTTNIATTAAGVLKKVLVIGGLGNMGLKLAFPSQQRPMWQVITSGLAGIFGIGFDNIVTAANSSSR